MFFHAILLIRKMQKGPRSGEFSLHPTGAGVQIIVLRRFSGGGVFSAEQLSSAVPSE
jgi:hypothetical protein